MKYVKMFFLILGALVFIAAGIWLLYEFRLSGISINTMQTAAEAQNSAWKDRWDPTMTRVWFGIAGGAIGGFLLGIGVGMPRRTFTAKLKAKQAEDAAEAKDAADKAAAKAAKAAS